MSLSVAALRAGLLAVRDLIDTLDGGALWLVADEPMAPSPGSALAGAPAAIIALGPVSFDLHPTEARMTCIASGNAASSGTITWARFVDGDGVGVLDVPAGPPGSGAQLIVTDNKEPPSAVVWSGGEVSVEYTLTAG